MDTFRVRGESQLRGTNVVNAQGDRLGEIREIVLDLDTGTIAYAVLSFGGFLGAGDKLFAVPWEAFRFDTGSDQALLDVPKDRLEHAPGFSKDDWPTHADHSFLDSVYSHYGYGTYQAHRNERYGAYEERKRQAREGTTLDVIDPKRDGIS